MDYKLTSVKLLKELYKKFKANTLDDEFTLQKLVNRSVHKYINEDEFRDDVNNYTELQVSGSQF